LFAFGALTLLLAVVMHFEPRTLWDIGDRLRGVRPAERDAVAAAAQSRAASFIACGACGLVNHAAKGRRQRCLRCGAALHRRRPDSVMRTWSLLGAAALLYIPANLLPVTYSRTLISSQDDTIISGVMYFWANGSKALAVLIFTASIVVPVLKLAVLALLAWTSQRRSRWRPLQRTKLYRLVEFVGRWSMLDIFVITLTVALVRFQSLAVITAGPGALAFCAVVVLTMLATLQFDPRLIWDPVTPIGEKHV
jgi:paraquat-inducible protein A